MIRDSTVDMLRGVAVAAMTWGHLGVSIYDPLGRGKPGVTLESTPPMWAEVLGGIAPVLFLVVSGMMVAYSSANGGRLPRQLIRMGLLFGIGAFIDVVFWRIRPFTTVDVLYCIGIALPLSHLFATRAPPWSRWPIVAAIFAATPWLQRSFGYADYPIEYNIWGKLVMEVENPTSVLNHWFIDGWFPLFPWLGFAFLGVMIGARRFGEPKAEADRGDDDRREASGYRTSGWVVITLGAACLAAGLLLGWPDASNRSVLRLNAGGAFMPPDAGYMLASTGELLLLLALCDRLPQSRLRYPLHLLGMVPLFLYMAHYPLIGVITRMLPSRLTIVPAVATVLAALAVLAIVAWLWMRLRAALLDALRRRLERSANVAD